LDISEIWNNFKIKTRVAILDWFFVFSIMLLLLIVYIPKSIWIEEKADRDESRFRMRTISDAAEFYKELTGNYTTDGEKLFGLVEAAIDSAYADSLFVGDQQIVLNNRFYNVRINKGFDYRADTTFSIGELITETIIDTMYLTEEYTDSTQSEYSIDTNYVNSKDIKKRMNSYRFNEAEPGSGFIISSKEYSELNDSLKSLGGNAKPRYYKIVKDTFDMEITTRQETFNSKDRQDGDYLRKKYHLNPNILSCPLSQKDYILAIEQLSDGENIFIVKSPVNESNISSRYFFFEYNPGNHGYIKSGVQSWAGAE